MATFSGGGESLLDVFSFSFHSGGGGPITHYTNPAGVYSKVYVEGYTQTGNNAGFAVKGVDPDNVAFFITLQPGETITSFAGAPDTATLKGSIYQFAKP